MGSQYAGDDSAFPIDFTIPDDGDPSDASSLNVALEALGDRTAFLKANTERIKVVEFLASGTYTTGARIVAAIAVGCGGGGGSARGRDGTTATFSWQAGSGGGGGALLGVAPVVLTPSTLYNIDIGAGGIGSGSVILPGGDGGDTVFRLGGTALATFPGAQGGRNQVGGPIASYWEEFVLGGLPIKSTLSALSLGKKDQGIRYSREDAGRWLVESLQIPMQPAQGGWGAAGGGADILVSDPAVCGPGQPNPFGAFAGGVAGTQGSYDGNYKGGGGGGGGGAGPFGNGGAGGVGGNGSATTGGDSTAGGSPLANSGAGAGGPGAGGSGGTSGGIGHDGSSGGSGRMYLIIVEP